MGLATNLRCRVLLLSLLLITLVASGCSGCGDETQEPDPDPDTGLNDTGHTDTDEADVEEDCEGCLIDGVCVDSGDANPDSSCQACDPELADDGWSPAQEGESCGPGALCQQGACRCEPGFTGDDCDQCVIHVNGSRPDDAGDGRTWGEAKRSVQGGIEVAAVRIDEDDHDSCQVWVAEGLYTPGPEGIRDGTFLVRNRVHLYGGFRPGDTHQDDRDPRQNTTILSGDINLTGDFDGNSYTVVTILDAPDGVVLDGFTISDGNADLVGGCSGENLPRGCGGGILARNNAVVTLRDVFVRGNRASTRGGGMYVRDLARVEIHDSLFLENESGIDGGAIYAASSSVALEMHDVEFDTNSAENGGALVLDGRPADLIRPAFVSNTARNGGAIFIVDVLAILIDDASFTGNHATADDDLGGGGALFMLSSSEVHLRGGDLVGNSAFRGGAIRILQSELLLEELTLRDNEATAGGGAIYCQDSGVSTLRTTFEENRALSGRGGAVHLNLRDDDPDLGCGFDMENTRFLQNQASAWGGAIKARDASIRAVNVEFWDNSITDSGGGGAIYSRSSEVELLNTTFYNNRSLGHAGGAITSDAGADLRVRNSLIFGNSPDNLASTGALDFQFNLLEGGGLGAATVDADPLFVDPDSGNLSLQPGSPARDAGDPDTEMGRFPIDANGDPVDLLENPRVVGDRIDLGARED